MVLPYFGAYSICIVWICLKRYKFCSIKDFYEVLKKHVRNLFVVSDFLLERIDFEILFATCRNSYTYVHMHA